MRMLAHYWVTRPNARFRRLVLLALLLAWSGFANAAFAQSFLHAEGPKIVNASGQEVILNGINLGGWALQEGYMMKPGWGGLNGRQTQGTVKRVLYNAGMSDAAVEAFYQNYRNNFIQKPDLDYIAAQGFNCVRLPMHYDLFLTPAQRAVRNDVLRGTTPYASYVAALTSWYNANELFVNPADLDAVRMIDDVLNWAQANNLYVILDLHAAPGAQGTDLNIADALQPLDFWNQAIYQDITNRLWATIAARYRFDARVAMYDLINEPNNVPRNQQIHDVFERLINTVRAQDDRHLVLLEGNGFGNNYDYMERRTFTNQANLVYNSHRYSGTGYLLDNNVNSSEPNNPNQLRTIGNLTRFRLVNNVPIWVGETGENTGTWMNDAARSLNSVGIGWCHWTYKRFEAAPNAALLHINPPYIVDGPAGLTQALLNMQFANCVPNPGTVNAVSPTLNGFVNYPGNGNYEGTATTAAPIGAVIRLRGNNNKFVSSENGAQAMTCTRDVAGAGEEFLVESAGGSKIALRSLGRYVSSEGGAAPVTCNRPAVARPEKFDWVVLSTGLVALRALNDRYVSSEGGTQAMTCTRAPISPTEVFRYDVVALATSSALPLGADAYPNPVSDRVTYQLPAGMKAHSLRIIDAAGRTVLTRRVAAGEPHTVDVSALPNGLYLVQLSDASATRQFRIVKQ